MLDNRRRVTGQGPLYAGIGTGIAGLVISYAYEAVFPPRPLGDPMPLVLSFNQLTGGFLYFQWRPPLFHLLFAITLGLASVVALRHATGIPPAPDKARFAGRVAGLVNAGVVIVLSTDAVIVFFWYLIAGLASALISGFVAGRAAGLWTRTTAGY